MRIRFIKRGLLLIVFVSNQILKAQEITNGNIKANMDGLILPQRNGRSGTAEYFAANPASKLLMPVSIFGEVRNPGIYYLPSGTTLLDAVGMAGGPTPSAKISKISIVNSSLKDERSMALYSESSQSPLNPKDVILIDSSLKSDLPLIFGGISITLSVATFALVLMKK